MLDNSGQGRDDSRAPAALAELNNQLTRAYLSGDGSAVERVMALIAVAERRPRPTANV